MNFVKISRPPRISSSNFGVIFDIAGKQLQLARLEEALSDPSLWNDNERAQVLVKQKASLERDVNSWLGQQRILDDATALLELGEEAGDADTLSEGRVMVAQVSKGLEDMEIRRMLSGEHDEEGCIVQLKSGAGGTDAQDWVAMMLRMYSRWAEANGYKIEIMDLIPGEEAGFSTATFTVTGPYAFGYMRAEVGVHRLVRISPFDANARRQTSFASVAVFPDIDTQIHIDIADKDLRIDVFRSSGAGGQSVNTTDSAVRITHLPTGMVVSCQNERSQHKNKAQAMKILRARLYDMEERRRKEESEKAQDKKAIEWGSQIRSYVLQPYQMVKDHRNGYEVGAVNAVLDGDVTPFMQAQLAAEANGTLHAPEDE